MGNTQCHMEMNTLKNLKSEFTMTVGKHSATVSNFFNSFLPRLNGRHFADDIFRCIFINENVSILIQI